MFYRPFFYGDDNFVLISSPKNLLIPQCNPSQIKIIMSIPRNLCFFPIDTVRLSKVSDIFQSLLCLLLHHCVIPCCCQHTTLLCIDFIEWCYLLCTCHMYLSGTPVTLGYFNIDNTTVFQTPCIHIRFSEGVGIEPLRHSQHVHFSCV